MRDDVTFVGSGVHLDPEVQVEAGVTLWGPCWLLGRTRVERGAVVHPGCHLTDTDVGPGAVVKPYTVAEKAVIGAGAQVGPFAHLREGTVLGERSRVGNFVETKQAVLGPGTKANHLAYLGDVLVGADANVGAGTVTCNYDGALKHRTTIGAGAFVGTNSSLVAPVRVGEGALVAAGSVIVDDVPDRALAVARGPQVVTPEKGAEILSRNRSRKTGAKP